MLVMGTLPTPTVAAESEALDENFLDYLGEFESTTVDWSWFDSDAREKQVKKQTPKTTKPVASVPSAANPVTPKP